MDGEFVISISEKLNISFSEKEEEAKKSSFENFRVTIRNESDGTPSLSGMDDDSAEEDTESSGSTESENSGSENSDSEDLSESEDGGDDDEELSDEPVVTKRSRKSISPPPPSPPPPPKPRLSVKERLGKRRDVPPTDIVLAHHPRVADRRGGDVEKRRPEPRSRSMSAKRDDDVPARNRRQRTPPERRSRSREAVRKPPSRYRSFKSIFPVAKLIRALEHQVEQVPAANGLI